MGGGSKRVYYMTRVYNASHIFSGLGPGFEAVQQYNAAGRSTLCLGGGCHGRRGSFDSGGTLGQGNYLCCVVIYQVILKHLTLHTSRPSVTSQASTLPIPPSLLVQVVGGTPSFEDIALRFVDVSGLDTPMPSTKAVTASGRPPASSAPTSAAAYQDALALFLSTKLSVLGRGDRAQATMVAAWLTELYLDQMNRELLEAGGRPGSRYLAQEVALRTFLTSGPSLEALDPGTTCTLLAG